MTDLKKKAFHRKQQRRYERLGAMFELLAISGHRESEIHRHLVEWLFPLSRLKQVHVTFDQDRKASTYVAWAFLAETTLCDLRNGVCPPLHISELNEGENLCIIDMAVSLSTLPPLLNLFLDNSFSEFNEAHVFEWRRGEICPKVKIWRRTEAQQLRKRLTPIASS